jgi:hypothetical protein
MTTSEKESEVVSRTLELLQKDPAHFDSLEIAACRDELVVRAIIPLNRNQQLRVLMFVRKPCPLSLSFHAIHPPVRCPHTRMLVVGTRLVLVLQNAAHPTV